MRLVKSISFSAASSALFCHAFGAVEVVFFETLDSFPPSDQRQALRLQSHGHLSLGTAHLDAYFEGGSASGSGCWCVLGGSPAAAGLVQRAGRQGIFLSTFALLVLLLDHGGHPFLQKIHSHHHHRTFNHFLSSAFVPAHVRFGRRLPHSSGLHSAAAPFHIHPLA